jgi:hypothetical protein|tara:strand:+ start:377 stop:634 length:258 start_codon:yes stop_codon:yes gene_type:complete
MSDDPIRNIGLTQPETIHQIEHTTDKPMKRERKKKKYNPKREKDSVELNSPVQTDSETAEDEIQKKDDLIEEEENKRISVDILVK